MNRHSHAQIAPLALLSKNDKHRARQRRRMEKFRRRSLDNYLGIVFNKFLFFQHLERGSGSRDLLHKLCYEYERKKKENCKIMRSYTHNDPFFGVTFSAFVRTIEILNFHKIARRQSTITQKVEFFSVPKGC